jgi:formiminoglutamase
MSEDPSWPRASAWLGREDLGREDLSHQELVGSPPADLIVLGVPAHRTSISTTGAHATPAAVRAALARYSTFSWSRGVDIATIRAIDAGDVTDPDFDEGEARVAARVGELSATGAMLFAIGGDNSLTYSVARGVWGDDIGRAGLITLDAHHDLRDGVSNGSPVRRLIEAGLSGRNVVQVGIADFSNSAEYAARAQEWGITVITRAALRHRPIADVMTEALAIAGGRGGPIHVDLDVDVCDRSVVPACPAAAPGGISADELRQAAFSAGRSPHVRSMDIAEIDATADAPDQRTVRLGALCLLEAASGVAQRVKAQRDVLEA